MATPQAIITAQACAVCPQASLPDMLEIGLLNNIMASLGTTMTAAAINEAAACFICYGMSLAQAQKLVLLNAISVTLAPGGSGTVSPNLSGAGSPVGVVTPNAVNQFYRDTTGNALWQATGLTNTSWIQWV